jgi:Chaperone of endosialidase
VNVADVGNSAVYETPTVSVPTGAVGIGTTTPLDQLHLRFNNTNGAITGLAVQNLGNTNTSYSGMLFYDQFGNLGQFQGFNNVTHEYRINNIATNASINFMTGSTSRFRVAPNGNIGIGTTSPSALLEVSNAVPGGPANMWMTSYTNAVGPYYMARRARGTPGAPTAVQNGDGLAGFIGHGYGATGFGGLDSGMFINAAENWTDTAQGTRIQFFTTNFGTTVPVNRMTLSPSGFLGLGTNFPGAVVDVVRTDSGDDFRTTVYGGGDAGFIARKARGTVAAPSAVQSDDSLGIFGMTGYGATGFGQFAVGVGGFAAENWTDTAQGAGLYLAATPLGSNFAEANLVVLPGGNVGIGVFNAPGVITDRLQVFGDIRMGTAGTNGCLRNFAGTGLIGTCSSDRRFKKDITPFTPVLSQLTALLPVHYFWRASDFPQQHFGDSRAYGLIAQDVEAVLPELVVTGEDGFKAVDYTKLPLLTIQAVKELKAEKDALKQRVDELERLVTEMLAAAAQR